MKKSIAVLVVMMMVLVIAACGGKQEASNQSSGGDSSGGSSQSQQSNKNSGSSSLDKKDKAESDYPNKAINVIVSYSAGGGTDTGARILLPYVEDILGVPMNVVNKPGGGGWVGWTELANAKPDGYTIGYINTPNLMTGYLNPEIEREQNLSSFKPIANHVTDPGAICVSADSDIKTIDDLIEYAKENEMTATSTGVGSDDHYASLKLNHKLGTKFKAVHNSGSANSKTAVLGGHVDVLFANVGEVTTMVQNGEVRALAVMSKERAESLPDVPTLEEKGFGEIYSWSARGLAAPAGLSDDKLKVLVDAFEQAINNEEQIKEMAKLGLAVDYQAGDDYKELLESDESAVKELLPLLGWE